MLVFEDEVVVQKVDNPRWGTGEQNLLGKEPRLIGSEFFNCRSLDDYGTSNT